MFKHLFAVALLLSLFASGAQALSPTCQLISADELRAVDFVPVGDPAANSMDLPGEQVGAPSDLAVSLCFFYADKQGSRNTFGITIETFVKSEGLAEWLASKNAEAKTDGGTLTQLGDATCEQGSYLIDKPNKENSAQSLTQTYVSCDHLVGRRRISVSFERPLGSSELPAAAVVKTLLDKVTAALPAPAI